jgi:hypothetical protein
MPITTILQSTQVDGVGALNASDIIQDSVTGLYVRQIQVFYPPDASGNPVLAFTLTVTSPTKTAVEFTFPATQF